MGEEWELTAQLPLTSLVFLSYRIIDTQAPEFIHFYLFYFFKPRSLKQPPFLENSAGLAIDNTVC